jgi:pimeloyl-ACP methyl ester carboxylesterase
LTTGYLKRSYLGPEAPVADELLRAAEAAEAADRYDVATLWRQRELALVGWSRPGAMALVDVALKAERVSAAVLAARPPREAGATSGGGAQVELSVAWGCRGDRTIATDADVSFGRRIDAVAQAKRLPKDACLFDIDTAEPCPPHDPYDAAIDYVGLGGDESELTDEQRTEVDRRNAELAREHDKAMEAFERRLAGFRERMGALRELFPDGPVLMMGIEDGRELEKKKLYLATLRYQPSAACYDAWLTERTETVQAIPSLTMLGSAELVLSVPFAENATYALIAAESEEAALAVAKRIKTSVDLRDPRKLEESRPEEVLADLELPMVVCEEPCGC